MANCGTAGNALPTSTGFTRTFHRWTTSFPPCPKCPAGSPRAASPTARSFLKSRYHKGTPAASGNGAFGRRPRRRRIFCGGCGAVEKVVARGRARKAGTDTLFKLPKSGDRHAFQTAEKRGQTRFSNCRKASQSPFFAWKTRLRDAAYRSACFALLRTT